jgi:ATP-binding cassette subfamily F protein uup
MAPPLLSLRDARLRIGQQVLFAELTLAIGERDRIALVGRNGAGKSTLLKVLAGLVKLDQGERFLQPRVRVAYLPQEPDLPARASALDAVARGLADPEDNARHHLAESALERFGIEPEARVGTLSGGEARRVALARAVVDDPDILLLDEPTNHLDIKTIERLEADLQGFRGALVMISHDRRFLEALSRTTWWLDRGRLRSADQGFAGFDDWSAAVLAAEEAELHRLQKAIEAETDWLHFGVTARRKRNQGRLRRLQAMRAERAGRIRPEGQVQLGAGGAARSGTLVIEADAVVKRFGERVIVEDFSTRIQRGDRVGIIGPNGAGKTTLIRLLTGALAPDEGKVRLGTGLELARIDQRRDTLDLERSPWETLCPDGGDQVAVRGRYRHVVGYLKDFLFRPEQLRTPVRALSGGERNRLLLARELARPANLLVLDEPTNDLDVDTLDLLQETLADFAGTLLLVSHDRDFLDRLVTSTIVLEGDGRAEEYAGGYSDYLSQRRTPRGATGTATAGAASAAPAKPRGRPTSALRELERELARLVKRIDRLRGEQQTLEADLADPDLYRSDPTGFEAKSARLDALHQELDQAEERWLAVEIEVEEARS